MTVKFTPIETIDIKLRYVNEPTEYIASLYNCNSSIIDKFCRNNKLIKKPVQERVYSIDYLSYKYSINENELFKIAFDLKTKTTKFVKIKYKLNKDCISNIIKTFNIPEKTFNIYSTEEFKNIFGLNEEELKEIKFYCQYRAKTTLCKMFGITESTYDAIVNTFGIEQVKSSKLTPDEFMTKYNLVQNDLNNAEIYLPHFSNRVYSTKFNIELSTVQKLNEYLNITRLPTDEQLCHQCMINYRTEGYKSIKCKQCHTKNMSEYQKVYYPLKIEKKKTELQIKIQKQKDTIKSNSRSIK